MCLDFISISNMSPYIHANIPKFKRKTDLKHFCSHVFWIRDTYHVSDRVLCIHDIIVMQVVDMFYYGKNRDQYMTWLGWKLRSSNSNHSVIYITLYCVNMSTAKTHTIKWKHTLPYILTIALFKFMLIELYTNILVISCINILTVLIFIYYGIMFYM